MPMTYRELLNKLQEIPEDRLDDTATVYVCGIDEFISVKTLQTVDTDVLDPGHFVISINDGGILCDANG